MGSKAKWGDALLPCVSSALVGWLATYPFVVVGCTEANYRVTTSAVGKRDDFDRKILCVIRSNQKKVVGIRD